MQTQQIFNKYRMICFKQIKYTTLENKRSKVLAKNIYGKRKCSNLIEA